MSINLQAIASLVNSPDFIEFIRAFREPNIFKSIARTHTETWHSAFLGWLLHSASSHHLRTYPLKRFISLLAINDSRTNNHDVDLYQLALLSALTEVNAEPNEEVRSEITEIEGRFDVLVTGLDLPGDKSSKYASVSLLIEMKVNAAIDRAQCAKYIHYAERKSKEGILVIPVFVAPSRALVRSPIDLLGSDAWIMVSFQDLYDEVISDSLKHPDLSDSGRTTLLEYVKNLTHKTGDKMPYIITDRERDLVEKLYLENKDAIEIIFQILSEQRPDMQSLELDSVPEQQTFLSVQINGTEITGTTVPKFYYAVLEHLVDNSLLEGIELPIATGSKRLLISREPIHRNGKPFTPSRVFYKGIYMEANKSPQQAKTDLRKLLDKVSVKFDFL